MEVFPETPVLEKILPYFPETRSADDTCAGVRG